MPGEHRFGTGDQCLARQAVQRHDGSEAYCDNLFRAATVGRVRSLQCRPHVAGALEQGIQIGRCRAQTCLGPGGYVVGAAVCVPDQQLSGFEQFHLSRFAAWRKQQAIAFTQYAANRGGLCRLALCPVDAQLGVGRGQVVDP
ncbi:hypothetical protein D3C81_1594550 [compost metagenome]